MLNAPHLQALQRLGTDWPPPEADRPARIAWLMPSLIEGSGGHRTILQNVQALIERGHDCHLFVEHAPCAEVSGEADQLEAIRADLLRFFGFEGEKVHLGFTIPPGFDLVFATAWHTASVAAWSAVPRKAYFVQDFEAFFMPMGDGFLMAENSYRLGLTPVSIGRWLTHRLNSEFGSFGSYFDFCADHTVYRPLGTTPREQAVCMICQPEKPRRCPRLGIDALGIVKHHRPDVKILLYGSKDKPHIWYEHEWHGLLNVRGCNELYNRAKVGLCISSSNPSRIPFEMMSAGLPVVDIHRENNLYDQPDECVSLAGTRADDIARAIMELLDDERRRDLMAQNGLRFMADRSLEHGYRQFIVATETILQGRENEFVPISRGVRTVYHRPPVLACHAAPQPSSIVQDGVRASSVAEGAARSMIEAKNELGEILRSRAWRTMQQLKRLPPYNVVARLRFGPDWDRVDPAEDPRSKLHRLKASRAYKVIQASKRTTVYRWFAERKYGPTKPNGPS